jgi:hypothetical protein
VKNFKASIVLVIIVLAIGITFSQKSNASTVSENKKTIQTFFQNYGIISDWTKFQNEQSKILSPNLKTIVTDQNGKKIYLGPQGYFASLGDWAQEFSTNDDFKMSVQEVTSTAARVRLHGTLILKNPINGQYRILDNQHAWRELFQIGEDGKISEVRVQMNILPHL